MTNSDSARIKALAKFLHVAATLALTALPIIIVLAVSIGSAGVDNLRESYAEVQLPDVIGTGTLVSVRVLEMVEIAIIAYVLWQMRELFGFYKAGETLSARCAAQILRIGQGLVTLGVYGILSNTVIVLVLTLGNPPGSRTLSISFTDGDVGVMMAGGLMVVIGWVMREAVTAAEENRSFV